LKQDHRTVKKRTWGMATIRYKMGHLALGA
jgi:hypothetical protein